jgi:integrase
MHGSIRQRNAGSWELRVFVATDPDTGRRIDRTATVRGTRSHAEHELAAMVASVRSTRSVGVRSPMSELLEAWFAVAELGWAPTTVRQTRSVLSRYLHPHIGDVLVGNLTPAGIDALYVRLRRSGGVGGRPLQPGSLARIHVVLRSSLAQAMRWGWIWDNPAERAHRIVQTPIEIRPPTPSELRALLDYIAERDPLLHAFVTIAAITGARRAQVLALRWGNIDLERARVAFRRGWVEGPNGPVLTTTKTKRSHVVDIDPTTFAVIVHLHETLRQPPVHDDFVFTDDGGTTAWKPNRVTKNFLRNRRAAGLRAFRLHDLRHFMATEMLHAGVPIVVVSRRLDHRRISTTLDRYAHAVPGADAHASATLAAIISS